MKRVLTQQPRCVRCGRVLKDPESIRAGIGPVCAAKARSEAGWIDSVVDDVWLSDGQDDDAGVFWFRRSADGLAHTNVPYVVHEHSADFEWGYAGSGPADLALNILEVVLRRTGFQRSVAKVKCHKGRCYQLAYTLHQDFKREFVAMIDYAGGSISVPSVELWLKIKTMRKEAA